MKRFLLVDDHPMIPRGLEAILLDLFADSECSVAINPAQALEQLGLAHWDMAIVDVNLPQQGGFALIRDMKERKPKLPILVYSMYAEEEFGLRALQAGADGYVPKDAPVEELPKAVHSLLAGRRYIREGLAGVLVNIARGGMAHSGVLSNREEQVLRMLAAGKTASQISESLALSVKSVSTYRSRVLEKLGLQNTAELIRYAMDHGYV